MPEAPKNTKSPGITPNSKEKVKVPPTEKSGAAGNKVVKTAKPLEQGSDATRKLLSMNVLALGIVFALALSNTGLVWYATTSKVEVIATTESGQITKPIPMNEAFVTEARVLSFADECLRASFSHDFENFRRTLNAALPCYTSSGGKELTKEIEPLLNDLKSRRLIMNVTTEPAVLVRGPRLINGRPVWDVQVVITMYFQSAKERFPPQQRVANVSVVRIPIEEDPRGIAINAIQLAPYVKQY